MRIGTSRSDRIGFTVFIVLAALLAILLVQNPGSESQEVAQEVNSFADLSDLSNDVPPPAVQETEPLVVPTATPEPEPIVPLAAPEDEAAEEPAEEETEEETEASDEADASTADGDAADGTVEGDAVTVEAAVAQPVDTAAATQATSDETVPNPQLPEGTEEVPNPQLPEGTEEVPNPQLPEGTEEVPNPQLPEGTTATTAAPATVPVDAPAGGTFTQTLTATVSAPSLHTSAGGPVFTPTFNGTALPAVNPTVFGNPLVYRVLAGQPGDSWAKVYVPARPNGTTAWVQTSQFQWGSSNQLLQINITNNTVTLFEGSNVVLTTAAVTGKSSSRTPLANGWVEEIMAGPSSAFGPRLISLGIFSDDLNTFGGSIPKIALHGTNNPGLMGQYASNGCIRVPNDVITAIASRVRLGSKVVITT